MDYVKPADVASAMINSARHKLELSPGEVLVRGCLSGAILGVSTSLAFTGAVETNYLVGSMLFPVGIILIVLLGLELLTSSLGLLPLPWIEKEASAKTVLTALALVFVGNLIGSVAYGALLTIALTYCGTATTLPAVATKIIAIAELKTLHYEAIGYAGLITAFVKAMLCNWMVCLAIVTAMTSTSTIGKIACAYMPIFIFFAQGFEHSVVNMFIIPTGMMLGAKITISEWLVWNQIPVTLGNLVGGFVFTGLALYTTHKAPTAASAALTVTHEPAE